ncbi:MAG TPA: VOC family protein [Pyrinomonadaceae bacterium]|nr:VOC family protein [Pyrinomonadaceae bacterium]
MPSLSTSPKTNESAEPGPAQKITPFLWFDDNAEEAINFYTSLFPNSQILSVTRYGAAGPGPEGAIMTASFQIAGQKFVALNGGPHFKFTEAISFVIDCESQEEVDRYWEKLTADGGEESQCGWLKDKYGLSWQVTPRILIQLIQDPDKEKANRVFQAMLKMKKIEIPKLLEAAAQR